MFSHRPLAVLLFIYDMLIYVVFAVCPEKLLQYWRIESVRSQVRPAVVVGHVGSPVFKFISQSMKYIEIPLSVTLTACLTSVEPAGVHIKFVSVLQLEASL